MKVTNGCLNRLAASLLADGSHERKQRYPGPLPVSIALRRHCLLLGRQDRQLRLPGGACLNRLAASLLADGPCRPDQTCFEVTVSIALRRHCLLMAARSAAPRRVRGQGVSIALR